MNTKKEQTQENFPTR